MSHLCPELRSNFNFSQIVDNLCLFLEKMLNYVCVESDLPINVRDCHDHYRGVRPSMSLSVLLSVRTSVHPARRYVSLSATAIRYLLSSLLTEH